MTPTEATATDSAIGRSEHLTGPLATIATICFDGFGDENFEPTFAHAPEVGIGDIEFNAWYARNLTPGGLASIKERCAASGLRPASLQVSPFAPGPDSADLAREASRWCWLIEAAAILGVNVIKATGSARGTRGGLTGLSKLLDVIVPIAEEHQIVLALENHFDNVLEHPSDYRLVFSDFASPNVGMCLDTGHFIASGHELHTVVEEFRDRIVHLDLKDCAEPGSAQFVRFGDGIVDFDGVISNLVGAGYAGHIVVEYPRSGRSVIVDDLASGAAFVDPYIHGLSTEGHKP